MNDLRLILLGIGLLIIAVIYLWGTFKQKSQERSHMRKLTSFKRDTFADIKAIPIYDDDEEVSEAVLAEMDDYLANPTLPDTDTFDFPLREKIAAIDIKDDEKYNEQDGKLSKLIPGSSVDLDTGEQYSVDADEDESAQQVSNDQIITFLIKSSPDKEFSGIDILKATEAVGLKFGDMNIFHHHGVEDMETTQAIFSLASMYEPGYFDLDKMEDYKTKGLTLFMQLPTPIDNMSAFDLIQETAIKLSDMLEGEVWSSKHKAIDEEALRVMHDMIVRSS